ncbi:MAG: sialate O-acetylesterase [Planctomycetes bacterium]|nr:sialate O-acetylesterase [Planctomycetota bacterium]
MKHFHGVLSAALAATLATPSFADVRVADVFGESMVIQRERPIVVWGEASPGERVEVALAASRASTTAGADGRWRVELAALGAGGPHELVIRGTNVVRIGDVLVGDVWLCSGQSNMEWAVLHSDGAETARETADPSKLRFLRVPHADATEPQTRFDGQWQRCTPETVDGMSAVGWYFAVEIAAKLDVPIGLVQATKSGAPAEPFVPRAALEADPELAPALRRLARAEKSRPGALYNAMIAPLAPFGFRGVLWYQGESNVEFAGTYRRLLPTLIQSWRATFADAELPFLIVQLPSWGEPARTPAESRWAELREAQALARVLPNVECAVTLDLAASTEVHPREKRPIARRLALLARARVYGEPLDAYGPRMRSVEFEGARARVRFDHADGLRSAARAVRGFQLAGADRVWHFADAWIEDGTVVVRSDAVRRPLAVRYGWSDLATEGPATVDLFDGSGLPAEPFRSDDWTAAPSAKPRAR